MFEKELEAMIYAAKEAEANIMKYYHDGFNVEIKEDNSPVTEADKTTDALIRKILGEKFPTYAFLTEESVDDGTRLENDYVFIVDPVDGTKDFVAKDDMFTCNIALAYKHKVVVGVVGIPAQGIIYFASKGNGSFKMTKDGEVSKLNVNEKTDDLTCLTSVFHSNEAEQKLLEKHSDKIKHIRKVGSSIKACQIAEGLAEITYRLSDGTKEWDTAAFQCIVEEAGGLVLKLDKTPIIYNRKDLYNRGGYLVINKIENFLI